MDDIQMASGRALRVLIVHNAYQQRGGEDSVVEAEADLLRRFGHEVHLYLRHNDEVEGTSRLGLAAQCVWSPRTSDELRQQLSLLRPDVVHVHNTLPLVSPSVYWAAQRAGVPVVQTLHNFRLLCPQATFLREGRVCEDCLGRVPWRGVAHRCYRGSLAQSGTVAAMLTMHRALGTYRDKVDRYIALNEFCKAKFVAGGLPAERIAVKPNFVDDVPAPQWRDRAGGLYVGRLSEEKGIEVLLAALASMPEHQVEVIGGGAFEAETARVVQGRYLGFRPLPEILSRLARASYLVLPSVCYEGFPRTIVEAFACGAPVVASRLGSMAELVTEGQTGLLFNPGDPGDLAVKLRWADAHPQEMARMGQRARREYEQRYTPEKNCAQLTDIYRQVLRAKPV